MTPDIMRRIVAYVGEHRTSDAPFDMVVSGLPPGEDRAKEVELAAAYAEVGVTWWIAPIGQGVDSIEEFRTLIRRGPPKAS